MDIEILQQYIKNIKEFFYQKLSEMEALQDRQAAEIDELTDKVMILGFLAILLFIVIIILVIVIGHGRKKRKRKDLERREEELRRQEERLREERYNLEQERIRANQGYDPGRRERREDKKRARAYQQEPPAYQQPEYQQPEYQQFAGQQTGAWKADEWQADEWQPSGQPVPEGQREYGTPSRRVYQGRQDDKAARENANRETQYFGNQDDWM